MAVERSMQVRLDMLVGDYIRNASAASKATMGIASAAEKPKSALDRVGDAAKATGRTIAGVSGAAVAGIASWGVAAFAAGAAFNTLQQTAGKALVTVLGSAEAASAQMETLVGWARTSPFPRQLWIEAQQTLLGFGFAAEDIVPTLAAIQDGMVAVGGGEQQIREVVGILAQVNSTGQITAETLNQLAYRGIDAATLLGDAWGTSAAQIRTDVSSGAIDAQRFITTLTDSLQERFAGAAEGLRTTWVGAVDRIKGATRDVGAIMAEPFIDPAGGGAAVQWANDIADALRSLEAIARPAMEVLRDRANPAFESASAAAQRFAKALREVDLVVVLDGLTEAAPALTAVGVAAAAAGSASLLSAVGMGTLGAAINPVVAGVVALAATSPELRRALGGLLAEFGPLIPAVTELAINLAEITTSAAGLAAQLLSVLIPVVSALVTILTPVVELLAVVPAPVLAVSAAAVAAAVGITKLVTVLAALKTVSGSLAIAGVLDAGLTRVERGANRASAAVGGVRGALIGLAGASVIGIIIGLANALDQTGEQLERVQAVDVSGLARDLEHLVDTGMATAALTQLFGDGAESAEEFVDQMYVASEAWWDWSHGLNRSINENSAAEESFSRLDSAMAQIVESGHDADQVLSAVAQKYDLTADEIEVLLGLLPRYTAEADRQANANQEGADSADEYADGLEGVAEEARNARLSLAELADEIRAQTDPVFAAIKAARDYEEAQEKYAEAVSKNGASSSEAAEAAWELLDAQAELHSATSALADQTSVLPTELIAMAEAAGIGADGIAALLDEFEDMVDTGQIVRDAITDINGDISTSTGQMAVVNALVWAGMGDKQAETIVRMKARVDELIEAGWSYEDALAEVARQSNTHTSVIEAGFEDARAKGLEFSDDYPAHITLTGADRVMNALDTLNRRINSMNKTVTISFQHRGFQSIDGISIPGMSKGGPVEGPFGAGDVVPRMLQPGEHVWTVDEVQGAGGHAGVAALRAAALAGQTRVTHSWAPIPTQRAGRSGITVENVNIETINERLDARQVQNELYLLAVS